MTDATKPPEPRLGPGHNHANEGYHDDCGWCIFGLTAVKSKASPDTAGTGKSVKVAGAPQSTPVMPCPTCRGVSTGKHDAYNRCDDSYHDRPDPLREAVEKAMRDHQHMTDKLAAALRECEDMLKVLVDDDLLPNVHAAIARYGEACREAGRNESDLDLLIFDREAAARLAGRVEQIEADADIVDGTDITPSQLLLVDDPPQPDHEMAIQQYAIEYTKAFLAGKLMEERDRLRAELEKEKP